MTNVMKRLTELVLIASRHNGWWEGRVHRDVADAIDEIERLRAALADAAKELDAEHRPAADVKGRWCIICGPADGSWPCVSKMVADDLRRALDGEA